MGSRKICTFWMPMSSSAQPVTGMAPVMLVAPSLGVSNEPKGGSLGDATSTVTLMVTGELPTPAAVSVILAVAGVPGGTDDDTRWTLIVPPPVPAGGVTWMKG